MPRSAEDRQRSYVNLVEEIWHDVLPLIGPTTLSMLFRVGVRRAGTKHPFLAQLKIVETGIEPETMRQMVAAVPPEQVASGLAEVVRCLMTLFESVAGLSVVRQLVPKVSRAERDD